MSPMIATILCSVLICMLAAVGCTKKEQPAPVTASNQQASSGTKLSGEQLFKEKCALCHKVAGQGGVVGSELTGIGARKDAATLLEFIKKQKSVNPSSAMPSFENLPADELEALITYLMTLK